MPEINQLTSIDTLSGSDLIPVYQASNSDTRKSSMSTLLSYIEDNLTLPVFTGVSDFTVQRSAPNSDGFIVNINNSSNNTHLNLTPVNDLNHGTIVFPSAANAIDKQRLLITCSKQINTLTIDINGATAIQGAPLGFSANDFVSFKYDLEISTWVRIG